MESIGFWARGPSGNSEELSQGKLAKLGGALQGVVELCCEVAKMEGVEMKQLLNRTYETYGHQLTMSWHSHMVSLLLGGSQLSVSWTQPRC